VNTKIAKPGDIIRVTNRDNYYYGQEFAVVEYPPGYGTKFYAHLAYVVLPNGHHGHFIPEDCEIIEQHGSQDAKGDNTDTEAFLRRQLDDNLRSVFG